MNAPSANEQLAVLCANLTGAAQLQAQMNPTEAEYALHRCQKRLVQAVEGHAGRLVKRTNDTLVAHFCGSEDALLSAVDIQRRISALPPMAGVSLGVKVGVCVGHGSREERFFEDEATNPAINLSGIAEPGQLLLSVPARATNVKWTDFVAHQRPEIPLACGKRKLGVFEIDWRKCHGTDMKVPVAPTMAHELRLVLHYEGNPLVLDRKRPLLTVGRLSKCDLALKDDRCSRIHARIEQRGNQFILIDQSTNGTFLTIEGSAEQRVHRREQALTRRDILSFSGPERESNACRVEFSVEDAPMSRF